MVLSRAKQARRDPDQVVMGFGIQNYKVQTQIECTHAEKVQFSQTRFNAKCLYPSGLEFSSLLLLSCACVFTVRHIPNKSNVEQLDGMQWPAMQ